MGVISRPPIMRVLHIRRCFDPPTLRAPSLASCRCPGGDKGADVWARLGGRKRARGVKAMRGETRIRIITGRLSLEVLFNSAAFPAPAREVTGTARLADACTAFCLHPRNPGWDRSYGPGSLDLRPHILGPNIWVELWLHRFLDLVYGTPGQLHFLVGDVAHRIAFAPRNIASRQCTTHKRWRAHCRGAWRRRPLPLPLGLFLLLLFDRLPRRFHARHVCVQRRRGRESKRTPDASS